MTEKSRIVAALGEERLLRPALVAHALRANDRAKYAFALLQQARGHADRPEAPVSDLRRERLAAGIDDATLDGVVGAARRLSDGRYAVPKAEVLIAGLIADIEAIIAPLDEKEAPGLRDRLARLHVISASDDTIGGETIDAMTSADRGGGDSLHLLVMDAHRALNRLQVELAEERLDGASVCGLDDRARRLVRAFMAGLNRTAPLKFDHPGLGTTATLSDGRLLIQNDIGTTDAHVLVVAIADHTATVTYTDVHLPRLAFFQRQFRALAVDWSVTEMRSTDAFADGSYAMVVGHFEAADDGELARFLDHLGSRIVFLIDWNRARKRLRKLVGKADAAALLDWAADENLGHRGFLEIGAERAVFEAIEFAGTGQLHYGDTLVDLLGGEGAVQYLRDVLRSASEGMRHRRSVALIKDEIKLALRGCLQTAPQRLLSIAVRHAAFAQELAAAILEFMLQPPTVGEDDGARRFAARAQVWESAADQELNRARSEARLTAQAAQLLDFLQRADDAADDLEEAAFLLSLLARHGSTVLLPTLMPLADILDDDARTFVGGLECARRLSRGSPQQDLDDFLSAVERIFTLEHQADRALRQIVEQLITQATDFRELHMASRIADVLERASDGYAHATQVLRRYVLDAVMRP
ncbi:MAG: hypothetical protein ACFCUO_02630 [Rhodospirillales bacterium]